MRKNSLHLLLSLFLVFALLAQPVLTFATPTPSTPEIEAARAKAAQARQKMDDLATQLEIASEEYFAAKERLEATTAQIAQTQASIEQAQQRLDQVSDQLGDRADATYRNGALPFVNFLVGANSFQDLVTRLDMMRVMMDSDAALIREVRAAKAEIEQAKIQLEQQQLVQAEDERRERSEYQAVQSLLVEQQQYAASLDAQVTQLVAEERARLEEEARRKAEEEARRLAEAEARRRAELNKQTGAGAGAGGDTSGSTQLGESRLAVVAEARKYLGVTPYVWGGTTPSGFDCSGLTQYCYLMAVGINIPRTSRQQVYAGTYIPADRKDLLQPGDLVFFSKTGRLADIHHVGIYSGNSMMIHAPQTGQKVSESYAFRSDYVGACRP